MRPLMIVVLLVACGRRDDSGSGSRVAPAPAHAGAAPLVAPATTDRPLDPTAVASLDAMLGEIDAAWRTSTAAILIPKARAGFRVVDENGVAVLLPEVDLSFAAVARHLAARVKDVKNPGIKPYTDGSLVALDETGARASQEPVVVALNDKLILFLQRSQRDPALLGRIDVAMP